MKHINTAYLKLMQSGSPMKELQTPAFSGLVYRVVDTLIVWLETGMCRFRRWRRRRETIAALSMLDDHLLSDIGLDRGDLLAVADGVAPIKHINRLRRRIAARSRAEPQSQVVSRITMLIP